MLSTPKKPSIKGPVLPPQAREVKYGTRDIDPCPIIKYKFLCSFECSRCQEGLKGNRAMGAYISNKIIRHTLLPFHNTTPLFFLLGLMNIDNVTRDIDPGIIFPIQLLIYIIFRHTLLPSNTLYTFSPSSYQTKSITGSVKLTNKLASSRTISAKPHN